MSIIYNPPDCKCYPKSLAKKNYQFGGNYVNSSNTNGLRYSQLVRIIGGGQSTYAYNNINAFGYYAGAPQGSGQPPRNYF